MSAHTPGEWEVANQTDIFTALGGMSADGRKADHNDGWQVAECSIGATFVRGELNELSLAERRANARRIVQCVNAHDDLLSALQGVMAALGGECFDWGPARAAIAKAGGAQ